MDEYEVIITNHALTAMAEIRDYIAITLSNPSAALRYIDLFQAKINELTYMPGRIRLTPESPWHEEGIRRFQVQNYYVYFRIDQPNYKVYVIDVVFVGRDQKEHLFRMSRK